MTIAPACDPLRGDGGSMDINRGEVLNGQITSVLLKRI